MRPVYTQAGLPASVGRPSPDAARCLRPTIAPETQSQASHGTLRPCYRPAQTSARGRQRARFTRWHDAEESDLRPDEAETQGVCSCLQRTGPRPFGVAPGARLYA